MTSKEEKQQLKNEIEKAILDHEIEIQKNVTERWKADSSSDSWLSKNVRPLVLVFLVVSTVLGILNNPRSHSIRVCKVGSTKSLLSNE